MRISDQESRLRTPRVHVKTAAVVKLILLQVAESKKVNFAGSIFLKEDVCEKQAKTH
jgi:hypothetical protein